MAAPLGSEPDITFISGVTFDATVAPISYGSWTAAESLNPATYDPILSSFTFKWGSTTLLPSGTPGGNVSVLVRYGPDGPGTAPGRTLDDTAKEQWLSALDLWSAVANITFTEAPDGPPPVPSLFNRTSRTRTRAHISPFPTRSPRPSATAS